MFGLSLTADVRIIKFKTLLVRPNDLLERELKLLYTNRMPGSSAEYLNTQNTKGLLLPAEPFNLKSSKKKCGMGGGRRREEAVLTRLKNLELTAHTSVLCLFPQQHVESASEMGC